MASNPKLLGSNIVDCIPQAGECPLGCVACFYNGGRFFRPLDGNLIPTVEEAAGMIVRFNSGHDSNINKEKVLALLPNYEHSFVNTAIPKFDFPVPVVYTCNPRETKRPKLVKNIPPNLMFVRFRLSTGNLNFADMAVDHYLVKHNIPVIMTFMRYVEEGDVPDVDKYALGSNIKNAYWLPRKEVVLEIMARWGNKVPSVHGVRMCGTPYSSYCGDCRNCEFLYWECLRRMTADK